ncbi:MAG: glycosyltransferase family 4 protein [Acidobacteriota bacterium]|nr:glycosyltransferase family 4 protein [Acidobacteriota bacterium]
MPPTRSGVAHYSSMLIPALQKQIEVEVITDDRQPATGHRIYQLGNNPHHEWIYKEAMKNPGVIVLHDIVLHHLIVEMTLARGDVEGYIAALEANHGAAGAAWGRGRAAGLHSEMGNFLLPASIDVANRSRAVIVHNRYSADRLRDLGVRTPIHVVPHPYEPHEEAKSRRNEIRAKHGFTDEQRVIGLFGFLTSAKRSEVVLEAFAEARYAMPNLQLLVVGEAAPNIDLIALGAEGVTFTGYVSDEDFDAYFAAVDRLVNLRYPTAGETSGTLIRAFEAGKPVAVSDYAQFAELPDDCVAKIPFGDREVAELADFFKRDLKDPAGPQQRWLKQKARMELTVAGYLAALQDSGLRTQDAGLRSSVPLFPKLELVSRDATSITIRNAGNETLRARSYGEPGYHIVANGHWLDLPGDLKPGDSATIDLPLELRGQPLDLFHAVQGIPAVDPKAWVRVAVH